MDLNYDLETWEFTLQRMTQIKIVQQIVEAARLDPFPTADASIIGSRTKERAQNLRLPSILLTTIINMILPILEEILRWYKDNDDSVCPILTPQGTVDVAKSAKAWMEFGNRSAWSMFDMACRNCCEEEILLHGQRLIHEQDSPPYSPLMNFWFEVYDGQFVKKITKKDLSEEQCDQGMEHAIKSRNLFATKYFLEKASSEKLHYLSSSYEFHRLLKMKILPDMCVIIYPHALSHADQSNIASEMLITLLKWPYQHLFVIAAETLSRHLYSFHFFKIANMITMKLLLGYADHDYKELFTCFWNTEELYQTKTLIKILDICDVTLLHRVFLMLDKKIAFMVLDDLKEIGKKKFLEYYKYRCNDLIFAKKYEAILFFLEVYKAKEKQLYLDFKRYLEKMFSGSILPKWRIIPRNFAYNEDFEEKQWNDNLSEFQVIMSEWESRESKK